MIGLRLIGLCLLYLRGLARGSEKEKAAYDMLAMYRASYRRETGEEATELMVIEAMRRRRLEMEGKEAVVANSCNQYRHEPGCNGVSSSSEVKDSKKSAPNPSQEKEKKKSKSNNEKAKKDTTNRFKVDTQTQQKLIDWRERHIQSFSKNEKFKTADIYRYPLVESTPSTISKINKNLTKEAKFPSRILTVQEDRFYHAMRRHRLTQEEVKLIAPVYNESDTVYKDKKNIVFEKEIEGNTWRLVTEIGSNKAKRSKKHEMHFTTFYRITHG